MADARENVYRAIREMSRAALLADEANLLGTIDDVAMDEADLPTTPFYIANRPQLPRNDVIPPYTNTTFTVVMTRLTNESDVALSDDLKIHGMSWRLKVYPTGYECDTHISVFVELFLCDCSLLEVPVQYQYCIEMVCSTNAQSHILKRR